MRIHVFGDSHADYLFSRISNASIHVLGPWTMHRVGRDGANFVVRHLDGYSVGDPIVFVFGEIDVRCHVVKQSTYSETSIEKIIVDLATRYIDAIALLREHFPSSPLCLAGLVPPLEPPRINPDFPVVGSAAQRVMATALLNDRLRQMAPSKTLTYVPVPKVYASAMGLMKMHLSDGAAHIAKDCADAMCLSLSQVLGARLQIEQTRKLAKLYRAILRRIAAASNNSDELWTLGSAT